MSSISSSDSNEQFDQRSGSANGSDTDYGEINGSQPFRVDGLASTEKPSSSGMNEEFLLLAWLIVLLRTHEGEQVAFEWTRRSSDGRESAKNHLSMGQVFSDLESSIESCAATIRAALDGSQSEKRCDWPSPSSMVLSTSSLTKDSDEILAEVSRSASIAFSVVDF